jgi:hypothetical protein
LCPEFVLLNLKGKLALMMPGHAPACYQVQKTTIVQLSRPTYRDLEPCANRQVVVRGEQNSRAANVKRLAAPSQGFSPLI